MSHNGGDFCLTERQKCGLRSRMAHGRRRPTTPLLQMRGIVKAFPGVRALDGVDLDVRAGEVHCLLGQNGAGKSTLIKVLAGAHQPDEGEIRWRRASRSRSRTPVAATAARHRHDLPGARPRRRADRRREHLPRPRAVAGRASPGARDAARRAARAAGAARPPRDLAATARSAGCRRRASRSSAWRGRSRTTPG